jgi:hypothetical protein
MLPVSLPSPTFFRLSRGWIPLLLASAMAMPARAESRPWKNTDGSRTIQAELVRRAGDQVTLRLEGGRESTLTLDKLHRDDRDWLDIHHPDPAAPAPAGAIFDHLRFGDSRELVLAKLRASQWVEPAIAEALMARTGLNGAFRTRKDIGGLRATLSFDWTADGRMQELNLETAGLPESAYQGRLSACWKELVDLMTTLHGKPKVAGKLVQPADLANGSMQASHLWNLESGGSATVGLSREGDQYHVFARFTRQNALASTHQP